MQNFEFKPVNLGQLLVAVMMDGKWYTRPHLLKRMGCVRSAIGGTLDRMRAQGYLDRAYNPGWKGVAVWKGTAEPVYIYKWTGKLWHDWRLESDSEMALYHGRIQCRMKHCSQYSHAARELCS